MIRIAEEASTARRETSTTLPQPLQHRALPAAVRPGSSTSPALAPCQVEMIGWPSPYVIRTPDGAGCAFIGCLMEHGPHRRDLRAISSEMWATSSG